MGDREILLFFSSTRKVYDAAASTVYRFKLQKYKYINKTQRILRILNLGFSSLPFIGLKKLKKESLGTCLVIVRTVPRPLCFCFFLIVLTVTFFPFFQSIVHLKTIPCEQQTFKAKMAYHSLDKGSFTQCPVTLKLNAQSG
uniref:Uncharacterized protein n=1 Tax=Athene cunicularia TaxID=194338 RepID=A0A663M631_ATHCN